MNSELACDALQEPDGGLIDILTLRQIHGRVILFYGGSFIQRSNGSQRRTSDLLRHLEGAFTSVIVYSCSAQADGGWRQPDIQRLSVEFPSVRLITEQEGKILWLLRRIKKFLILLLPSAAGSVLRFRAPVLTPVYARMMRENADAILMCNYVDNLAHLNGVPLDRTIVETHDVKFFRRAKGTGRSLASLQSLLHLRSEVASLASIAGVVAITSREKYFFENVLPGQRVFYVPDYALGPAAALSIPVTYEHDLLFVGSHNAINERGFLDFVATASSWLGDYRITLCGGICSLPSIQEVARRFPNISLLGFVDEQTLESLYAKSKACLSPTDGTGLSIKLLDALRHGRPVFASRFSMEALVGDYSSCVFPLTRDSVKHVLGNSKELELASRNAANYYEAFSRQGDMRELDVFLRQIAGVAADSRQASA